MNEYGSPLGHATLASCHVLPFQISVNAVTLAELLLTSPRSAPVTAQFETVAHETPVASRKRAPPLTVAGFIVVSFLPFHDAT